jgi:protein-tyrosine-phosphatase
LLVVCRANLIRSPIAAGLLRRHLTDAGLAHVRVRSAGVQPGSDAVSIEDVARIAEERGVDLTHHRSTAVTAELAARASLVLTMTEGQRSRVTRLEPGVTPRTFTLVELVRLTSTPDFAPAPTCDDLARRAHLLRPLVAPAPAPEDVPDPLGKGRRYLQAVVDDLGRLCEQVAALIAVSPSVTRDPSAPSGP